MYVTPTAYLELIQTFQTLLGKKRREIDLIRKRYDNGLMQLEQAGTAVVAMQTELTDLKPQLLQSKKETEEMQVDRIRQPPVRPHPSPTPIPSDHIPSDPIRPHPVPSHPIPSHPVPSHPIPSYPTPSRPIPSHPIPSHPISPHPIPSHPVP